MTDATRRLQQQPSMRLLRWSLSATAAGCPAEAKQRTRTASTSGMSSGRSVRVLYNGLGDVVGTLPMPRVSSMRSRSGQSYCSTAAALAAAASCGHVSDLSGAMLPRYTGMSRSRASGTASLDLVHLREQAIPEQGPGNWAEIWIVQARYPSRDKAAGIPQAQRLLC
jgi:hypothetical protein